MGAASSANVESSDIGNDVKVAVLMGGVSRERDVSLASGRFVAQALREATVEVVTSDIGPDNPGILEDDSIDVFFIALHGRFGEDGRLQQILESRGLVYTGSGPEASRLAFDKMATKKVFTDSGVVTPAAVEFTPDILKSDIRHRLDDFGGRYVIKPIREGSTIGVSIVDDAGSAVEAARRCFDKFGDCMIEEYIQGRELTVGILDGQVLPIVEIRARSGFYDYHAKYLDDETEYLFDTIGSARLRADISRAALDCFNALGCRHFGRVDFILGNNGAAYALEVNTIPGLTSHSLLPKAAAKTGLSMSELCVRIVKLALAGRRAEHPVNPAMGDTG